MNKAAPSLHAALFARLEGEGAAAELAALGFDFLMAQPVRRFVTPEQVLKHLDAALRPAQVERVLTQHVRSYCDRDLERSKVRGDRVDDYLTGASREVLSELAARPVTFDRRFLESLVKQEAVRHLLGAVVEETIARFIQAAKPTRMPGLGKGLLSKLGAQMESQLQRAAKAFVATSLDLVLKRLARTLEHPETQKQLGRMRRTGFEASRELPSRVLWKQSHQLPLDELLALVPGLVTHNLGRADLREAILAEAEAYLEIEGDLSLAEILDEEACAVWRALAVRQSGPLVADFLADEKLAQWLDGS